MTCNGWKTTGTSMVPCWSDATYEIWETNHLIAGAKALACDKHLLNAIKRAGPDVRVIAVIR